MKKFTRVISVMAAVLLMTCPVNAERLFAEIIGKTDSAALGATVMVLDKGTNILNIKSEDIKYVNQSNINTDGIYSIKLPLNLDYDNLSIHSNMGDIKPPAASEYASIIYVSASGNDTNSGLTEDAPVATLGAAYAKAEMPAKIVLLTNLTYSNPAKSYKGLLTIEGAAKDIELALPATVNLYGNLTIDNLKITTAQTTENPATSIRARGYALTIGEKVSSEHRLTVYGGDAYNDVNGDTNITLLGGKYTDIYGGCFGGTVKGSTHVTIGGNVNEGDGIDDTNETTISPCKAYGGGYHGAVEGDTNITIKDNAVLHYLFGAGKEETIMKNTNVFIEGGKVMNVYGGSFYTEISTNTHITMTDGLAEAIFGGSQSTNMTGNTYVTLLGGDVSRRVYTGCYNNWSLSWSSKCQVIGTTNLVIGPNMKLNTKTELASGNQDNMGVFAGSRQGKSGANHFASSETNTVIFLNGCYEKQKDVMGEKSSWTGTFGSFPHYTVSAGMGGSVEPTSAAGTVKLRPDSGRHAVSSGKTIVGDTMTIAKSVVTAVTFEEDDFFIKSLDTENVQDGITANVGLTAKNTVNEPYVLVAVYDSDDNNKLIAVGTQFTSPNRTVESIKLNVDFEADKTYIVKAMIWNKDIQPLASTYLINLKK